jgi:hypothetical protein
MLSFYFTVNRLARKRLLSLLASSALAVVVSSCATGSGGAGGFSPLSAPREIRKLYVGPTVGFGINSPTGTFHTQTPNLPDCGGFTGGSNSGLGFGLVVDYWFASKLTSNSVILRGMMQSMPSTFTTDYGGVPVLNPLTGKPEPVNETHTANIDYSIIAARLAYVYMIPSTRLGVELGPSIGIAGKLGVRQSLQINPSVSPDVTFGNGTRDSLIYDASPSTKSGLRLGVWVGGQYRFDVGWWIISPYVGVDLGLTKVMTTDSWSLTSVVAGLDVRYGIK